VLFALSVVLFISLLSLSLFVSLIGEIMSLSQAVRVLLHMRRPGMFEEEF